MDQGDAKAEAKKHTEALKLYQAAHDLMGVPTAAHELRMFAQARAEARRLRMVDMNAMLFRTLR